MLALGRAPTILTYPVPLDVIIADTRHAVTAATITADMVVDTGVIGEEITVNGEARNQGAVLREPCLHSPRESHRMKRFDLDYARLPIGTPFARLIVIAVREALLVWDASVLKHS